jgi:hypothetical protein
MVKNLSSHSHLIQNGRRRQNDIWTEYRASHVTPLQTTMSPRKSDISQLWQCLNEDRIKWITCRWYYLKCQLRL